MRVREYVSGFLSTVFLLRSCSSTAYATMGQAVKIMLKVLIIMVVKIGIAEYPAHNALTTKRKHDNMAISTWQFAHLIRGNREAVRSRVNVHAVPCRLAWQTQMQLT